MACQLRPSASAAARGPNIREITHGHDDHRHHNSSRMSGPGVPQVANQG